MSKLRMLELCAGIGGAGLAAEMTGAIEVVGQVEIDPFCQAVLGKHWPGVSRMSDIREVSGDEFGNIDLMVGGLPCQPFSSAGLQLGTDDDRYLWPEMFRLVTAIRPTWVVVENVDDFISMALDLVQADLESKEYAVRAYVLPACAVGAPHERQRCFVVAHSMRPGRAERDAATIATEARHLAWRKIAPGKAVADSQYRRCEWGMLDADQSDTALLRRGPSAGAESESGVGRGAARIPIWLDRHRWPAEQGLEQHDWEPARTIIGRLPNRKKRIKALGNAIVPQQIYPIFAAIVEAEKESIA